MPPELQFSALLSALKSKQTQNCRRDWDDSSYTEGSSLILLKRPSPVPSDSPNKSTVISRSKSRKKSLRPQTSSTRQSSLSIRASVDQTRKPQTLEELLADLKNAQEDFKREKGASERLPLPALRKRSTGAIPKGGIPPTANERVLAEQVAAADRVMHDLYKRNKALQSQLQQRSSSHLSCQTREARLQEEVSHLQREVEQLKARLEASVDVSEERDVDFLQEREEDAKHYFLKFQALREKVRQFATTVQGEEAELLIKEMTVTDTERELYYSRLQQVLYTQWTARNEALLGENQRLQRQLECRRS